MIDVGVGLGLGSRDAGPSDRLLQLTELLAHLVQRPGEIGPVVADGRRSALHLARLEQRGKRVGNVVEDPLPTLLLGLDLLPALLDSTRRPRLGVTKNVRMATDELRVHVAGHGLEVALAALLEEQREEVDLEEKVAELPAERIRVTGQCSIGDFVRLLDRVRNDRALRLLAVPGALSA